MATGVRRLTTVLVLFLTGCGGRDGSAPPPAARNLILVTVDTLRSDRVGAYDYPAARTPGFDALARSGVLFTEAFAVAPITMTAHASLMTGLYPPGHGARHNGMRLGASPRTLAQALRDAGFATAAFVGAFPLDRRFGLDRGFDVYGDAMPRDAQGRPLNERPARVVAGDAAAWLEQHRESRFFLWVHFFEPHAPYGDARTGRAVADRYDDEIAEADAQMRRVLEAAGEQRSRTLVAVTADHGEAFGEHGEVAHSIFVYDTTLRVPLVIAGPGVSRRDVTVPVSHVDVPSTLLSLLGVQTFDTDGVNLQPVMAGSEAASRELYAESYAPLLDFGWSPLRSLRQDGWKYIEAPREELYEVSGDPLEARNLAAQDQTRARALRERLERYTAATPPTSAD
ncbi:MAG TPA: sulfatase, partial [Vicinamibacterales bacterium]|nr:sulfatase [Vicinamibacterales bacterium]